MNIPLQLPVRKSFVLSCHFFTLGSKTSSRAAQPEWGQNTDGPGKVSFIIQNVSLRVWHFFFSEGWECHFSCSLQERFTLMGETCRLISRKTCRGVCLSHHVTDSQHEVSRAFSREESQVSMCTLAWNTIKAALITIMNV